MLNKHESVEKEKPQSNSKKNGVVKNGNGVNGHTLMDFSKINFVDTINFIERNKTKFSYGFLSSNRKFIVGGSKYFPHGNVTQMCKS